jgi:hypothetical protein
LAPSKLIRESFDGTFGLREGETVLMATSAGLKAMLKPGPRATNPCVADFSNASGRMGAAVFSDAA